MITIQKYVRAQSLEEAWQLNQLKSNRILGGMLWLRLGRGSVNTAIDLCDLGLDTIEETEEQFSIGCMATLRDLELHPGLNAYSRNAVAEKPVKRTVIARISYPQKRKQNIMRCDFAFPAFKNRVRRKIEIIPEMETVTFEIACGLRHLAEHGNFEFVGTAFVIVFQKCIINCADEISACKIIRQSRVKGAYPAACGGAYRLI